MVVKLEEYKAIAELSFLNDIEAVLPRLTRHCSEEKKAAIKRAIEMKREEIRKRIKELYKI